MVYYGVTLNAVNMAGNPYLNFVSMAAIEVPANAMCILTFKYFGRRLPIFFYMLFGGINCLATSFVPQSKLRILTKIVSLLEKKAFDIIRYKMKVN